MIGWPVKTTKSVRINHWLAYQCGATSIFILILPRGTLCPADLVTSCIIGILLDQNNNHAFIIVAKPLQKVIFVSLACSNRILHVKRLNQKSSKLLFLSKINEKCSLYLLISKVVSKDNDDLSTGAVEWINYSLKVCLLFWLVIQSNFVIQSSRHVQVDYNGDGYPWRVIVVLLYSIQLESSRTVVDDTWTLTQTDDSSQLSHYWWFILSKELKW